MKQLTAVILTLALLAAIGCTRAESPAVTDVPAQAEGAAETAMPAQAETEPSYSSVTVTVRRDVETVSERTLSDAESLNKAREIVLMQMLLSAAWPGVEASELEDFVRLACVSADGTEEVFYQYDVEGRHVLQMGEDGMYSVMVDDAYQTLCTLAGLSPSAEIGEEAAIAMLEEKFGKTDAATGNTFSFAYLDTVEQGGKAYYRFRISWLVDGDHMSYLTDYLVAADGSELKEYTPDQGVPEAYVPILSQYADAVRAAYYADLPLDSRFEAYGRDVAFEWSNAPTQPYYALSDLDGDGTQELLILAGEDASALTFYDLWSIRDGIAVRPLDMQFGYRVNFDVYADGVLAVRWSNSAFESGCDFYRLNGAVAENIGSLVVASDPEQPDAMLCTLNGSVLTEAEYEEQLREFAADGMLPIMPVRITGD